MTVPTIYRVRNLMLDAGWNTGTISLQWSEQYIYELPQEQRKKIENICKGYSSDKFHQCFEERIIPVAIQTLKKEAFDKASPYETYDFSSYIPQIKTTLLPTTYTSPAGHDGPENISGQSGLDGKIIL